MTMMRVLSAAVMILAAMVATAGAAEPGASDWARSESGQVRLIAAATATGKAATLGLGLQFQLQPGWKIYWRTPGDAGYPPKLDWTGSDNLGDPVLRWPAPHRFVLAGLQNYGYKGEVVLPIDAPLLSPGWPLALRLGVDFLACAEICVPQHADLALDLPAGAAGPSSFVHDIGRFAALVPGDGARHGLTLDKVEAIGSGDASRLRLDLAATEPLSEPDAFVESDHVATFEQPGVTLSADKRHAVIEIPVAPGTLQGSLVDAALAITVVDGARAMEAPVRPVAGIAAAPAVTALPGGGLLAMMAVALLGGLILNLMPCVLPVLSIKVLGVLGHGGGERSHVRASFLASAAGIVVSFLALAVLAVTVRQAGAAVGWGIQFQHPGFLATMVVLLGLFAANLWGALEVPMPGWLVNRKSGGVAHHTVLGHFMSGAFATVLATPCSAPFLGTAIGFALARGPGDIAAIFLSLGLGMASPYLVVAAWPDAALRLPRPGAWMITVRKLLGVVLLGTGVWLLTVLAAQAGGQAALVAGGAVALAMAVLALKPRMPESSRAAVGVCVVALAGLAIAAPYRLGGSGRQVAPTVGGIPWTVFDRPAIAERVKEGKLVFVDVTADWCITCKVNKAAVIERDPVARRLSADGVVAMKADWTTPDEAISRYLAAFGRYGIPFNAVYGPAAPDGLALSELLSESEVLAALDKAAGVIR